MISDQVERLVLDVVLSHADDEGIHDLDSDVGVLEVDHLTMTHIVLALETELGIELPTDLEDARTVAELVTGVLNALSANAQREVRPIRMQ
jgi:acyl carrier protein